MQSKSVHKFFAHNIAELAFSSGGNAFAHHISTPIHLNTNGLVHSWCIPGALCIPLPRFSRGPYGGVIKFDPTMRQRAFGKPRMERVHPESFSRANTNLSLLYITFTIVLYCFYCFVLICIRRAGSFWKLEAISESFCEENV